MAIKEVIKRERIQIAEVPALTHIIKQIITKKKVQL